MHYFTHRQSSDVVRLFKVPVLLFTLVFSYLNVSGQITLSTSNTLAVNNGSGGVSFNLHAKKDLRITEIQNVFAEFNQNFTLWYSKDSINSSPFISSFAGWQAAQSGVVTGDAQTPKAITLNNPIIMRAGETFGFYIEGNTRFMTASALPFVFYDDNLVINTGQDVGFGGARSPGIADRQFVGQVIYELINRTADDIGVVGITNQVFCSGSQNMTAVVRNFGNNPVSGFQVNWSMNGNVQTPVSSANNLDTFEANSSYTSNVALGSFNFVNGQNYVLKVWTSSPNSTSDGDQSNDTLTIQVATALSGNYTIGGSSPDFVNIQSAITSLHQNGVCGPVSFLIRNGNYFEQMDLQVIKGASSVNTVEFVGESKSGVLIRHSGATGNPATVFLRGTQYVKISNCTISCLGTGNAVGVQFMNGASHNTLDNNIILLDTNISSPSSTSAGIVASSSLTSVTGAGNNASYNTISNNQIYGGYYGVRWNGISTSEFNLGNQFINNTVSKYYYYGMYLLYQGEGLVESNTVWNGSYTYSYNIYLSNTIQMVVNANRIPVIVSYGLYMTAMNRGFSTSSVVSNNIIGKGSSSSNTIYAIYCSNVFNTDIVHNTSVTLSGYPIYIPTSSTTSSGNLRVNNNIFSNSSGVALSAGSSSVFNTLDYNQYNTLSVNLLTIGSSYASLTLARTAYPNFNQHSVNALPDFVSANDFHLDNQVAAPAGAYIGIDKDFDGDTRCSLFPSMGADESGFASSLPQAGYQIPDTLWQGTPSNVLNNASATDPSNHSWYMDGNLVSTELNFDYNFPDTGVFELKLKTENCGGADSFSASIYVSEPTTAPIAGFTANLLDPEVFIDEVQFIDTSTRGASSRTWLITPHEYYEPSFPGYFPTYAWNSGDEHSLDPKAVFTKNGEYTICLIATNARGSDTLCKTNYISVKESINMCNSTSVQALNGVLYDDGFFGNYSSSLNCNMLIEPCASEITLNLLEFDLKSSDYLRIYDGEDSTGIPLWNSSSYANGMTGTITNSSVIKAPVVAQSGKVFVQFVTNSTTVGNGFKLEWKSVPLASSPIVSSFYAADTICQSNSTLFENTTAGQGLSYRWLVDGGLVGTQRNLTYDFSTLGTYEVQLISENCSGMDTASKTIVVSVPNNAPVPRFGASKNKVDISESLTLFDSTSYCISSRKWTISPANFVYLNGTNENSRNPEIRFTDTGCYSIDLYVENSIGNSNLTKSCFVEVVNYCEPDVTNLTSEIGISRVQFAGIDNSTSIGVDAYSDYTSSTSATVVAGGAYPMIISKNSQSNVVSRSVWIDMNQNGYFESSELLATSVNSNAKDWSSTISIPSSALLGLTRMRIGSNFGSLPLNACGSHSFGEFEDYSVEVTADILPPVLSLIGADTIWLEQGFAYNEPGASAIDFVDGDISGSVLITGSVNTTQIGNYTLTYSVSDQAGNMAIPVERTVVITPDTTAPVLVLSGNNPFYLPVFSSYPEPGFTAIDQLDGNISVQVQVTGTYDTSKLGTYTLDYTIVDLAGNSTSLSRTIVVYDSVNPMISLNGQDSLFIEVFNTYSDAGYLATDNYDTSPTVTITGLVNTNRIGTYILNFCAVDQSGNTSCISRKVVVGDTTKPSLVLLGNVPDTVDRWATYVDPGYDVGDNYDLLPNVVVGGDAPNTIDVGEFTLSYVAVDQSGNTSDTLWRKVIVRENPLSSKLPTQLSVQIYPNPSDDLFSLTVDQSMNNVEIRVLNILGKEVMKIHNGSLKGKQEIPFSMGGHTPGVYFVELVSEGSRNIYKIVLR